jgi:hypothetical protein
MSSDGRTTANREVAVYEMAYRVERAAGQRAGKPFRDAYARIVYADRAFIGDAEIDRLLAEGARLLEEMRE